MRIDAHHHLWDLGAVDYPWLMARGVRRFFGDPAPIQRDYLLDEFRRDGPTAQILLAKVPHPEHFGVAELHDNRVTRLEEKPKQPKKKTK